MHITNFHQNQVTNNETPAVFVSGYTQSLIDKFSSGEIKTEKGTVYSEETIRSYKYFLDTWTAFEEERGFSFNFQQVFPKLVNEYTNLLQAAGKSKNSIALILSKLKAVLKFAFMEGISFWNGSGIKTPTELTTKVYLSVAELQQMRRTPMTEGQERVIDGFLIQCFTGLRYDTLQKFLRNPHAYIKEDGGQSYIDIIADKTGEQSVIPLGDTVREILARNQGRKLTFSEVYTNRVVKIIAEKSNLTNLVATRITKGGKVLEQITAKSKLITTHTSRRSLISIAKQSNMTDREIQSVTGHKTIASMERYNRTTNLEKVKGLFGNEFFNTKI